jgi:hypothetical protein
VFETFHPDIDVMPNSLKLAASTLRPVEDMHIA